MSATKNAIAGKAETALMGITVATDNDEVLHLLNYIMGFLKKSTPAEEIMKKAFQHTEKNARIEYLNVSTLDDMVMLALLMTTKEDKFRPVKLQSRNGVFGYVYNATYPDCSELGYSFYNAQNRRIG